MRRITFNDLDFAVVTEKRSNGGFLAYGEKEPLSIALGSTELEAIANLAERLRKRGLLPAHLIPKGDSTMQTYQRGERFFYRMMSGFCTLEWEVSVLYQSEDKARTYVFIPDDGREFWVETDYLIPTAEGRLP